MSLTAAQTRAQLALMGTRNENPAVTEVTLTFRGVNFSPVALYDALDAIYGTVSSERDDMGQGRYARNIDLLITP